MAFSACDIDLEASEKYFSLSSSAVLHAINQPEKCGTVEWEREKWNVAKKARNAHKKIINETLW